MRWLAAILAIVSLGMTPGTAVAIPPLASAPEPRGSGTVWPFDFVNQFAFTDSSRCGVAIRIEVFEWHHTFGVYSEPVTLEDLETQRALMVQRWGLHQIHREVTYSNLVTGTSVSVSGMTTLIRRDLDVSGLAIDEGGFVTGTLTATDYVTGDFGSVVVPGEGLVLPDVGRVVSQHASVYVDSRRVGRVDQLLSTAGNFTFWRRADLCPYLA
jgi:hypothetical protein